MKLRYMRRRSRGGGRRLGARALETAAAAAEGDPLSGVANLFDVAMVFALGLLVMILLYYGLSELLTESNLTIVKNPGQKNMEVIIKEGREIKRLNASEELIQTEVVAEVGRIYRTKDGSLIYVPANVSVAP